MYIKPCEDTKKVKRKQEKSRLCAVLNCCNLLKEMWFSFSCPVGIKKWIYYCVCAHFVLFLHLLCPACPVAPGGAKENTMEKKDTNLEVKAKPAKSNKKKSVIEKLKLKLNLFWLKTKLFFYEMKNKKKGKKKKAASKAKNVPLSRKIIVVIVNLLAMAALVYFVPYYTLRWLDDYADHGVEYTVPSVHGKDFYEAVDVLKGNKLDYKVVKYEYRDSVAADVVLKMYPDSGSVVKEGRKIELVLSKTEKPKRKIPAVIDNSTIRAAKSHLEAAGFTVKTRYIDGEADWVYKVLYNGKPLANDDAIPEGSTVVAVIGNGKGDAKNDTPKLD